VQTRVLVHSPDLSAPALHHGEKKRLTVSPAKEDAGIDELCGNLGQDFVARSESVTLDFSNMTFSSTCKAAPRSGTVQQRLDFIMSLR